MGPEAGMLEKVSRAECLSFAYTDSFDPAEGESNWSQINNYLVRLEKMLYLGCRSSAWVAEKCHMRVCVF